MLSRRSILFTALALPFVSRAVASARPLLHRLNGTSPAIGGRDLAFLPALVANRDIVGLGEATHGSKEIFDVKQRVVRKLVESARLGAVAFELGYADGLALDDYVVGRPGPDALEILKRNGTFSIANAEILSLLSWLKLINATRPAKDRVRVFGYDIQQPGREAETLLAWWTRAGLSRDLVPVPIVDLARAPTRPIQAFDPASADPYTGAAVALGRLLDEHRDQLVSASSTDEFARRRRSVDIILQGFGLFAAPSMPAAYDLRDKAGADNILQFHKDLGRPVAVWAHNGHVNCGSLEFAGFKLLGGYLRDAIGARYYAVATAFFEGEVRARRAGQEGIMANILPPARAGSIDAFLADQPYPAFFVDFRQVGSIAAWQKIIDVPGVMRGVGAAYEPENDTRTYRPTRLGQQFDALIFVRHSSASTPLPA